MKLLISPKTQIVKLMQSPVLTRDHWRFKGDHRQGLKETAGWLPHGPGAGRSGEGGAWWSWGAASKAERGIMKVKAAGEEKEGWRCRLGRQGWGWNDERQAPVAGGGQRSRPFLTAECTAEWTRQWLASLRCHWPCVSTLNIPTPMGSVTSLLGVFPVVTLAQEI